MPYIPSLPFQYTSGPKSAKIMIIAEIFGESESKYNKPLLGQSGRELARMIIEAGFSVSSLPNEKPTPQELILWWEQQDIFITAVFPFRPVGGKISSICLSKKEVGGTSYTNAAIDLGKYVPPEYLSELSRLAEEIKEVRPNLIIALGNIACWAVLNRTSITSIRGTVTDCKLVPGVKVLPTFSPTNILRQWANRPIMLADLIKAWREGAFAEIRRPRREIIVNSRLSQIREFYNKLLIDNPKTIAIDIETKSKTITMVSFSYDPTFALVICFYDENKPNGNFWGTVTEEVLAWKFVIKILSLPIDKLFQNGLYDISYFYRMGIRPKQCKHDTMLLHHSILPEVQKSLGFLGSIYTNEPAWKLMRKVSGKDQNNKAGE